jgi:hypothetical protein
VVDAIEGRTVRTAHALTKQPGEYHEAREHGREVHLIGDALAPRRLMDAILDGARLGRSL